MECSVASIRRLKRAATRFGLALCVAAACSTVGCRSYRNLPETIGNRTADLDAVMYQVDAGAPANEIPEVPVAPLTLKTPEDFDRVAYREMSLDEAIQTALSNAQVLRDLGATVLRFPELVATEQTLGLVETDPQAGIEAALSAFDAQLYALGKFQNNDRQFNNRFFGGGSNAFKQDTHDYLVQMSKRTATGARFALRSVTDYDANNATGNMFPHAWQTQFHAEMRQPLLQGGGLTFNRIAGPDSQPGVYTGVLIAKVNNDITSAKFREQLRDYVSNVVNAYWDLYFAYRDLDAKRAAVERSRMTWESLQAEKTSYRKSGAPEALAREQFYRFESELHDAITGRLAPRTQVRNATTGGTFAGLPGVQAAERRLRLLIGVSISDGTLIRPSDEPNEAPVTFDWDSIAVEAIQMRSELQQQRLLIHRQELELLAAKNYLMPSLDLVTIYRLRGLDQQLAGDDSAFRELATLDFQEYEASLEFKLPVGFRQAHAAVQNARLRLSRSRSILHEQERQILHDLAAVIADSDRAYVQMQTNMNRYLAANDALEVLEANRKAGLPISLEQLLDAQRRASEAQSNYYLALADYMVAAKNVQFEKGTLLHSVHLTIADEQLAPPVLLEVAPPQAPPLVEDQDAPPQPM